MQNLYFRVFFWSCLILTGALFLDRIFVLFDLNPDIAGIEEVFVCYSLRLVHHLSIYPNPGQSPYLNCQYTPFYFETLSKMVKLIGQSEGNIIRSVYFIGRFINLLANIISSVIAAMTVYRYRRNAPLQAIVSGCIVFLLFTSHNYAVRPDSLKTLFVVSGFYFFVRALRDDSLTCFIYSLILATIAVFIKQDALMFLSSLLLSYALAGKKWWKGLIIYLMLIVIAGMICLFSYGPFFITNVLLGLHMAYSFQNALYGVYILSFFRFTLIAYGIFFSIRYILGGADPKILPIAILPLFMFPGIAISTFKFGASPVYYTDLAIIFLIVLASLAPPDKFSPHRPLWLGATLFLLIFAWYDVFAGNVYLYKYSDQKTFADYEADCKNAARIIDADTSANIFTLTFDKNLSNHLIGRSVFEAYETEFPQYMLSTLTKGNNKINWQDRFHSLPGQIFNYANFNHDLHSGKIKYLVLSKHSSKPVFLNETFENFRFLKSTAYFDLYVFSD